MLHFHSIVTFCFILLPDMAHGIETHLLRDTILNSLTCHFLSLHGTWQTSTSMKGIFTQHQQLPRKIEKQEAERWTGWGTHMFRNWKTFKNFLFRVWEHDSRHYPKQMVTDTWSRIWAKGKTWNSSDATWINPTADFWQINEHSDLSGSLCRVVAQWITKQSLVIKYTWPLPCVGEDMGIKWEDWILCWRKASCWLRSPLGQGGRGRGVLFGCLTQPLDNRNAEIMSWHSHNPSVPAHVGRGGGWCNVSPGLYEAEPSLTPLYLLWSSSHKDSKHSRAYSLSPALWHSNRKKDFSEGLGEMQKIRSSSSSSF